MLRLRGDDAPAAVRSAQHARDGHVVRFGAAGSIDDLFRPAAERGGEAGARFVHALFGACGGRIRTRRVIKILAHTAGGGFRRAVEGARGRTVIQINHGCMLLDGRIAVAVRQRHGIYYERAQKSASALRPNGSIPYSRAFCTILFTICSLSFGRQRLYNRIESCYATEIPTNQDWRRQPWFVRNAAHITRII